MQIESCEIRNFRGIKELRLDFSGKPKMNVFTLVGLNESGKTTILEAINHFSYKDETLNPLQLRSFEHLSAKATIIYTTHSHHMIDPKWLEGTFVVKNLGISYAGDPEASSPKNTNVTAMKYREFATRHLRRHSVHLIPGTGAGSNELLIKLYLAWNRPFILLLDSDDEGKRQKARYAEMFGAILDDASFTLDDIEPSWANLELEDLVESSDRLVIQRATYPTEEKFKKVHFHRALQELYLGQTEVSLSTISVDRMSKLLEFLYERLTRSTLRTD
jgi:hypothetical protein